MMSFQKLFVALTSVSMVLGSTAVAAAPVASEARSGSPVAKSDDLAGIGTFGILIAVLVVAGVIAIIASDNNNKPASP